MMAMVEFCKIGRMQDALDNVLLVTGDWGCVIVAFWSISLQLLPLDIETWEFRDIMPLSK